MEKIDRVLAALDRIEAEQASQRRTLAHIETLLQSAHERLDGDRRLPPVVLKGGTVKVTGSAKEALEESRRKRRAKEILDGHPK